MAQPPQLFVSFVGFMHVALNPCGQHSPAALPWNEQVPPCAKPEQVRGTHRPPAQNVSPWQAGLQLLGARR